MRVIICLSGYTEWTPTPERYVSHIVSIHLCLTGPVTARLALSLLAFRFLFLIDIRRSSGWGYRPSHISVIAWSYREVFFRRKPTYTCPVKVDIASADSAGAVSLTVAKRRFPPDPATS